MVAEVCRLPARRREQAERSKRDASKRAHERFLYCCHSRPLLPRLLPPVAGCWLQMTRGGGGCGKGPFRITADGTHDRAALPYYAQHSRRAAVDEPQSTLTALTTSRSWWGLEGHSRRAAVARESDSQGTRRSGAATARVSLAPLLEDVVQTIKYSVAAELPPPPPPAPKQSP